MTHHTDTTHQAQPIARHWGLWGGALLLLALAGCNAVEIQNRQPLAEVKHASQPTGTVYAGWRVFQDKCARCHGLEATGTPAAPNLLPRVRDMGPQRFVDWVLKRYDWNLPADQAMATGAARDTLIDETVQGRGVAISMPAWQGEPRVTAHIMDLYAYLSARADGSQAAGRPQP